MKKKIRNVFIIILLIFIGLIVLRPREELTLPVIESFSKESMGYKIFTGEGDILSTNSIMEVKKSLFSKNIIVKTKDFTVKDAIGIVESPPKNCITDIKSMVLEALDKDNDVLLIYIDGLGYEVYENAMKLGIIPHMASLSKGIEALTVYPPITDVTFASMITGETPKYTGIHNRDKKPLLVPTIFDIANEMGKTSKVIEGNIKIITDEVETILNIDENNNGTIDDEIYRVAMEEIKKPPNILLVHFHSVDDMGHLYGHKSQKTLDQLSLLDLYIFDLLEHFTGEVIITSDHGMHDDVNGGSHGAFDKLDMFIPIIRKN